MDAVADELELIRRTALGDAAAFRVLAERHLGRIMNYAMKMLHDRTEAEDVAQETFLRFWREAGRYEPRARLVTWLHTIAHHQCIDRLRRRRPTSPIDPDGFVSAGPQPRDDLPTSAVERALSRLPDRQRSAIVLVFYQELSNVEAAAALEISVDALESLLARARRSLRALLSEYAPGSPS